MNDNNRDMRPDENDENEKKRIRIATSIPSLKDKIQTDIKGNAEAIYWYIRFNIALNSATVTHKTMGVTDTSGYIMRTDISYDEEKNRIVISPLDTYEQDRYYLLRISKKVCSKKGQRLRSPINILFKLINNQISEYKVLRKDVNVPPSKSRPPNYDIVYTRSKVYSTSGTAMETVNQDKLPVADLNINIWLGLLGLVLVVSSYFLGNMVFIVISIAVCILGLVHMFTQLRKAPHKSLRFYNRGVKKFNKEKYDDAKLFFQRAIMYDDSNEYAEYALYKVEFYIN